MKAASLLVLFALRVLFLVTLAAGQPKALQTCSKECRGFSSEIAAKRIRSYRRSEPACRKKAIILVTVKSAEICADPDNEWVKKIMKNLDQKQAAASLLPRSSAAAPEEPAVFQKHVGLTVKAPSQSAAPTSYSHGTGTAVSERTHVPAAGTEASSQTPPAAQDTGRLPAGVSPVTWEGAARSQVTPEANRGSLKSPPPSTTVAAGVVSSQPTPYPTALVRGFDNVVGSTEEPVGHTANATADVRDVASPSSREDPTAITEGSHRPVLPTGEPLDPTSAGAIAPDTGSSSVSSDLPSTLPRTESTPVPATRVPPATTSVSTLNSATATGKAPSGHTGEVEVVSSPADSFGTRTSDYSPPVGKRKPSDALVFTSQALSGQARVRMTTGRPNDLPLPGFSSGSQMHFVIPVSVVGGLMACSVAAVWLYLKFGVKTEELSREMVQGLLYQGKGHQNNAYPMEVI